MKRHATGWPGVHRDTQHPRERTDTPLSPDCARTRRCTTYVLITAKCLPSASTSYPPQSLSCTPLALPEAATDTTEAAMGAVEGQHNLQIADRPSKTWLQTLNALLFVVVFNLGCLMINGFQFTVLLPLRLVPFAFGRRWYNEGLRYSKGAFGTLLSKCTRIVYTGWMYTERLYSAHKPVVRSYEVRHYV